MPHEAPPEGELYASLKAAPTKRLVNGIERVDGLSPEEGESLERGGLFALRGTKRRVLRWTWYAGFVLALLRAFAACIAVIVMVGIYINEISDSGKLDGVISAIMQFMFGAAATLAAEFLIKKASNGE